MAKYGISHPGEFGLIDRLKRFQNLSPDVIQGIGDDAAVLELDRQRYLLFTTDILIEGVHFRKSTLPKLIGRKALACSVSDIAAMGGRPTAAVVSIGLPAGTQTRDVMMIYQGMNALAKTFGVSIVGGDTIRANRLVISVALLGEVAKKNLVTRSGARPGDVIFVSGPLGNSLRSGRHLKFVPRVKEARFLVEHFRPSAMMDISDGIAGDLAHILKASGVGAVLEAENIPLARGAGIPQAMNDGEDFELLFTLSAREAERLLAKRPGKYRFYPVGRITASAQGLELKFKDGTAVPVREKGFRHF